MNLCARIIVSLFLALLGHLPAQTSLNYNLGGPGETIQDRFIFTSNGITATATAWSMSRTASNATLQESEVVQWSPGIGAKNSTEVITDTPYVPYYVDNQDHYDFILFVFSQKVDISKVTVHPSAGTFDLDASYWLGNIDPSLDLTGKNFSNLTAAGFGSRINDDSVASNSPRTLTLSTPLGGVNALLFGARVNGDSEFDRFKISSIQGMTVIPEPSSAGLLLGTLVLLAVRRRR